MTAIRRGSPPSDRPLSHAHVGQPLRDAARSQAWLSFRAGLGGDRIGDGVGMAQAERRSGLWPMHEHPVYILIGGDQGFDGVIVHRDRSRILYGGGIAHRAAGIQA